MSTNRMSGFAAALLPSVLICAWSAAPTVAGKWKFVMDTPGGAREAAVVFVQDGDQVSGTWDGDPVVKGAFRDGKLELNFELDSREGGRGTLKISAQLDGDTLTGKWAFSEYSGEFKATREK